MEVTSFIRKHAWEERHRNCIICRIAEEMPDLSCRGYNSQVRSFLTSLSTEGNWDGKETIMAVSNMFKVDITIHFEEAASITFKPHNERAGSHLNIVYRLLDKNANALQYNQYVSLADELPTSFLNLSQSRTLRRQKSMKILSPKQVLK